MINVTVKVSGGGPKVFEECTFSRIKDVKEHFNLTSYSAQINGEPARDDSSINDYDFITLSPPIKGA